MGKEFGPLAIGAGIVLTPFIPELGIGLILGGIGALFSAQEQVQTENYGTKLRLNTRSTEEPIRIIYGQTKVGGNDVFIESSGTNNQYLWIVQALGEGECDSIAQSGGSDLVYLNDDLYSEFGGNVSYWFHSGSSTQTVDSNLNSAISKWTDTLKNVCYIVFRLQFDNDYFQGMPARTIVLNGKQLYDYRDGTTAYSNNAALVLYDYMSNNRYGMGLASSKFDTTTWTSAANYCDTKGFTFNGTVEGNKNAFDVINQMLSHFRGTLVWYDGKFYLKYADLNYESSVMTIDDSHIAQDNSGMALVSLNQPSRLRRPDSVSVAYIDPDKNYQIDNVMVGDGFGLVKNIEFLGCTDREMASNLAVYDLERTQLDRSVSGTFRDNCLQLEPHDIVTFTSSALNISGQTMRVSETDIRPDGQIDMTLVYESLSLYNDDYDLNVEGTYTCSLPDINATPPSVSNVSLTEETYNYRLRTFTRLKCSFTLPTNYQWLKHIEVWISFDNATWEHLFNVTNDFFIDPVQEGTTYYIKLVTVSIWGTKQDSSSAYVASKIILGYNDVPSSITSLNAIANQNSVILYADKVADPDVETYEFRLGASWSGAIFLSALRNPNLSLNGVKPGTHTFWCNTLSNNGSYGSTPRSAIITLIDPPDGWSLQTSETDDYL